jgi:hypothetical protein
MLHLIASKVGVSFLYILSIRSENNSPKREEEEGGKKKKNKGRMF